MNTGGWSTVGLSADTGERCSRERHTGVEAADAGQASSGEGPAGSGEGVSGGGGEAEGGSRPRLEAAAAPAEGGGGKPAEVGRKQYTFLLSLFMRGRRQG